MGRLRLLLLIPFALAFFAIGLVIQATIATLNLSESVQIIDSLEISKAPVSGVPEFEVAIPLMAALLFSIFILVRRMAKGSSRTDPVGAEIVA